MTVYSGCGVLTLLRGWKPYQYRRTCLYQTTWLLTGPPSTSPPLLLPTADIKINCLPTHPSFSKLSFFNSFNSLCRAPKAWEIIVFKKKLKIGFGRSNEMVIRFGQPPSNRGNWVVKKSVVGHIALVSTERSRACQQPLYDNPRHLPLPLRKGNPIEFWEALRDFCKIWQPKNTHKEPWHHIPILDQFLVILLRLKMALSSCVAIENHKVYPANEGKWSRWRKAAYIPSCPVNCGYCSNKLKGGGELVQCCLHTQHWMRKHIQ